ncbi:cyclase family protein [Candidatus Uhrbacteria bacterium]|nr:cyclase family protein [Candidatus Uhrbacteria bacterium]
MKYIDLTHTFTSSMPVYPGNPKSELTQVAFIEKDECTLFEIKTSMHIGTHVDAPSHMLEKGKGLNEYPIEHFIGRGVLIDARGNETIGPQLLNGKQISKGDIILILTGFSLKFREAEYYQSYPVMTEEFAKKIVECGVKMIGVDTPSPDKSPYLIHKILLKNDVLIIENLTNLEALLPHPQFDVIALPIRFDAEASPIRVVAQIFQ